MSRPDETVTRDAISRTAQLLREQASRSGVPMTQTQAEERVRAARVRGDQIRESGNR